MQLYKLHPLADRARQRERQTRTDLQLCADTLRRLLYGEGVRELDGYTLQGT